MGLTLIYNFREGAIEREGHVYMYVYRICTYLHLLGYVCITRSLSGLFPSADSELCRFSSMFGFALLSYSTHSTKVTINAHCTNISTNMKILLPFTCILSHLYWSPLGWKKKRCKPQKACFRNQVIRNTIEAEGKSRVQWTGMLHWKGGSICCSMNEREEIYTYMYFYVFVAEIRSHSDT